MDFGISLIGTPDGFESFDIGVSKDIPIGNKVDLSNSIINIFPNTDIYMVRREYENNNLFTYITYYRYAKEIKTTRSGSFYGVCLVLKNLIPIEINELEKVLIKLADNFAQKCINKEDNRFFRRIRDFNQNQFENNLLQKLPNLFQKIDSPIRVNNRNCFLLLDEDVPTYNHFLSNIFQTPINTNPLNKFSLIYTSSHEQIVKEVKRRKGLPIVNISTLITKYQESEFEQYQVNENKKELAQIEILKETRTNESKEQIIFGNNRNNQKHNPSENKLLTQGIDSSNQPVYLDNYKYEKNFEIRQENLEISTESVDEGGYENPTNPSDKGIFERISDFFGSINDDIQKTRESNKNESLGKKKSNSILKVSLALISLVILGLVGSGILYFLYNYFVVNKNQDNKYGENTVYYVGCIPGKNRNNSNDVSSCTPTSITNEFFNYIKFKDQCGKFNGLEDEKKVEYLEKIRQSIEDDGNNYDGEFLSKKESITFQVDFSVIDKFCLASILDKEDSYFSKYKLDTDTKPESIKIKNQSSKNKVQPTPTISVKDNDRKNESQKQETQKVNTTAEKTKPPKTPVTKVTPTPNTSGVTPTPSPKRSEEPTPTPQKTQPPSKTPTPNSKKEEQKSRTDKFGNTNSMK